MSGFSLCQGSSLLESRSISWCSFNPSPTKISSCGHPGWVKIGMLNAANPNLGYFLDMSVTQKLELWWFWRRFGASDETYLEQMKKCRKIMLWILPINLCQYFSKNEIAKWSQKQNILKKQTAEICFTNFEIWNLAVPLSELTRQLNTLRYWSS